MQCNLLLVCWFCILLYFVRLKRTIEHFGKDNIWINKHIYTSTTQQNKTKQNQNHNKTKTKQKQIITNKQIGPPKPPANANKGAGAAALAKIQAANKDNTEEIAAKKEIFRKNNIQQSVVVLLGAICGYLEPTDPKVCMCAYMYVCVCVSVSPWMDGWIYIYVCVCVCMYVCNMLGQKLYR